MKILNRTQPHFQYYLDQQRTETDESWFVWVQLGKTTVFIEVIGGEGYKNHVTLAYSVGENTRIQVIWEERCLDIALATAEALNRKYQRWIM